MSNPIVAHITIHRSLTIGLIAASLLTPPVPAIAQLVQQGPKLRGTGTVGGIPRAAAVAISADGNTAIVGDAVDDGGKGAVWSFTRIGRTWSQQGPKLVGTGTAGTTADFGITGPPSPGG